MKLSKYLSHVHTLKYQLLLHNGDTQFVFTFELKVNVFFQS